MAGPELDLTDAAVQFSFAVHEALGSVAARFDASLTLVRLLGILRDRELGMLELAAVLGLEKSSVTGLVDRTERRGLVARTRSTEDARSVKVTLTKAGREVARRFEAQLAQRLDELLAPLPHADRARLTALLGRVLAERAPTG